MEEELEEDEEPEEQAVNAEIVTISAAAKAVYCFIFINIFSLIIKIKSIMRTLLPIFFLPIGYMFHT